MPIYIIKKFKKYRCRQPLTNGTSKNNITNKINVALKKTK